MSFGISLIELIRLCLRGTLKEPWFLPLLGVTFSLMMVLFSLSALPQSIFNKHVLKLSESTPYKTGFMTVFRNAIIRVMMK